MHIHQSQYFNRRIITDKKLMSVTEEKKIKTSGKNGKAVSEKKLSTEILII